MSILSATNLSQTFGMTDVFRRIDVDVPNDAKIGLIGPNGVGKTSLIKTLAGYEKPTEGNIILAKGKRVGYLPQEAFDAFDHSANSVLDEMHAVFAGLKAIEEKMRELEHAMGQGMTDAMADEYGNLQHEFELRGGYDYETRIQKTLQGLGFDSRNRTMQIAHLSGGQKTRALLAKLLLEQPDLLILDEPTNHLDVEAIEWLEETLLEWRGALIVCSHDRFFLDKVVNRVWEMSHDAVEVFRGNYSAYLEQRDARFEHRLFLFNQQKERMDNELRLIKRDLDAVKAGNDKVVTWAKGKLRRMTRDIVAIEELGVEALLNDKWSRFVEELSVPFPFTLEEAEKRVRGLRAPSKPPKLDLVLATQRRSGNIVLRTQNLQVGFPGKLLFTCDDIELRYKERAALIGANGAGKTTFLRTALHAPLASGERLAVPTSVPALAGTVELGASLKVGYFAQAHDLIAPNDRIIEALEKAAEGQKKMGEGELRYYLSQFLFRNDDVYKPVAGLSGGERARLALAILQLQGANFLVLDEPTNHLDLATQEVLEQALTQFDGTILMVSHDRYIISKLAQQIWHIHDGRLQAYNGTYAEYSKWRSKNLAQAVRAETPPVATPNPKAEKPAKRHELAQVESKIAEAEARLASIGKNIEHANGQTNKVRTLSADFAQAQKELDGLMREWEKLSA